MDNNDLFRRLRYALSLDDAASVRLMRLGNFPSDPSPEMVTGWRLKSDDVAAEPCPAEAIDALLAGLIVQRRGARDDMPPHVPASAIDNNRIAKQLRIALELRSEDVEALVSSGGGDVTASEISAIFRKPGHRNFRSCGDQLLRWLLAGIAARRPD